MIPDEIKQAFSIDTSQAEFLSGGEINTTVLTEDTKGRKIGFATIES